MFTNRINTELAAIGNTIKFGKDGSLIPNRSSQNVHPGDRMGLNTIQAIQDYIKRQKRVIGQSYQLSAGSNPALQIQLPGTARVLLGFAITPTLLAGAEQTGLLRMTLNNEIMIEDTYVGFFGNLFTDEEYYFIPRPLSGNDNFAVQIDTVITAYTANFAFYYL